MLDWALKDCLGPGTWNLSLSLIWDNPDLKLAVNASFDSGDVQSRFSCSFLSFCWVFNFNLIGEHFGKELLVWNFGIKIVVWSWNLVQIALRFIGERLLFFLTSQKSEIMKTAHNLFKKIDRNTFSIYYIS